MNDTSRRRLWGRSLLGLLCSLALGAGAHAGGMAETYNSSVWMLESGEKVEVPIDPKFNELQERLRNFLCQAGYVPSVVLDVTDVRPLVGQFDGGSARAPVWTDELGEVDLDQYTAEELAQMVRDFWTPERMKSIVTAEWPSADGITRPLQAGADDVAALGDDPVLVCVPSRINPDGDGKMLVIEGSDPAEGGK